MTVIERANEYIASGYPSVYSKHIIRDLLAEVDKLESVHESEFKVWDSVTNLLIKETNRYREALEYISGFGGIKKRDTTRKLMQVARAALGGGEW